MTSKELLFEILYLAWKEGYWDIHLNSKHKPVVRDKQWEILMLDQIWEQNMPVLSQENISEIIRELSWELWLENFKKDFELDNSYKFEDGVRYRVNCYIDTNGYSVALRGIPSEIPTLEDMWLNDHVKEMCNKWKWLILVTGPTWSWKSTNLAAMIDYINTNMKKHIITVEDPVEFAFESKKSLINQREIWNNTKGFSEAIRASLREDPDVIMVWEMRDPETIKAALTLAETGHLVLSTLHTNDSVQTVDRIVDIFPSGEQKQIRMLLAMWLVWVVSQRLLPRIDKPWRIAAREILIANDAIRNLIIWWKTHQIYSVLEIGQKSWMILMDKYLVLLYKKWIISKDSLLSYIRDKDWIEMLLD